MPWSSRPRLGKDRPTRHRNRASGRGGACPRRKLPAAPPTPARVTRIAGRMREGPCDGRARRSGTLPRDSEQGLCGQQPAA